MKVIVVGTHAKRFHPSMSNFAEWVSASFGNEVEIERINARGFFRGGELRGGPRKLAYYLDQYVLLSLVLWWKSLLADYVFVADHSNAPCSFLVPSSKVVVMVHDTIAIRRSMGLLPGLDRQAAFGRLLQRLTLHSLRRSRLLLTNPGAIDEELRSLGVTTPTEMVGCVFDDKVMLAQEANCPDSRLLGSRFVLYVGVDIPRKRVASLINTWRAVAAVGEDVKLVIAGSDIPDQGNQVDAGKACMLVNVGRVSPGELRWLYENCLLFSTASQYEGFCVPVLEAIAFRKRVLVPVDSDFYDRVFGRCAESVVDFTTPNPDHLRTILGGGYPEGYAEDRETLMEKYSFMEFSRRVRSAFASLTCEKPENSNQFTSDRV